MGNPGAAPSHQASARTIEDAAAAVTAQALPDFRIPERLKPNPFKVFCAFGID